MKNIAGTEPTETNRSATPSAPLDSIVASCTLGSTDAHAPQKSPSVVKPKRVADLRGIRFPERPPRLPPVASGRKLGFEPSSLGADVTGLILREAALLDALIEQLVVLPLDAAVRVEDQVELEVLRVVA